MLVAIKGEGLILSITKLKRFGNLYHKVYDMDNLRLAHKNARKGKTFYKEVQEIDKNPDYYLKQIQEMLINETYRTSEYEIFTKQDGKKTREIYKLPYYPDRICQWALIQVIQPILMRNLTADTYSAIPSRGIHYGLKRLKNDIKTDERGCMYCLKFDISKYYPSINHGILKEKYARLIKDMDVLWLINEIIDSTDGEYGIPIGNFLSQWSGNLFLSDLDHFVKEQLKIRHYRRYMDDVVILHSSKMYLQDVQKTIVEYLEKIDLKMKGNYQVFPTFVRGVDFLGYRVFSDFVLLRKTICKTMKRKILKLKNKSINHSEWCSFNSYKGWLRWCNSYRLRQKYIKPLQAKADMYYVQNVKKESLI